MSAPHAPGCQCVYCAEAKQLIRLGPRVIPAGDANEVMAEQLYFLIEHAEAGMCGCNLCERNRHIKALLLKPFTESQRLIDLG